MKLCNAVVKLKESWGVKGSSQPTTDIQEIFNIVIDAGFYDPRGRVTHDLSRLFMRLALDSAAIEHRITRYQCIIAQNAIKKYLVGTGYLTEALAANGLPYGPEDLLAVYTDWANRPELKL